jgi:hypothetical protein
MKGFVFLVLITASFTFAQQDFSVYPLTVPLEFGTNLGPLSSENGLELPSFPQASMQYVYPEQDVIYSMRFVEPDPATEYSMYIPESTATVEILP